MELVVPLPSVNDGSPLPRLWSLTAPLHDLRSTRGLSILVAGPSDLANVAFGSLLAGMAHSSSDVLGAVDDDEVPRLADVVCAYFPFNTRGEVANTPSFPANTFVLCIIPQISNRVSTANVRLASGGLRIADWGSTIGDATLTIQLPHDAKHTTEWAGYCKRVAASVATAVVESSWSTAPQSTVAPSNAAVHGRSPVTLQMDYLRDSPHCAVFGAPDCPQGAARPVIANQTMHVRNEWWRAWGEPRRLRVTLEPDS